MKKSLLPITLILFFCGGTFAQPNNVDVYRHPADIQNAKFKAIVQKLSQSHPAIMTFKQTKKIVALKRPLISSGKIAVTDSNGVCWKTQTPFKSSMLISSKGIKKKVGNNPVTFDNANEKIEIKTFVKIMLALFKADVDKLEKQFDVYFTDSKAGWQIGLKPKSSILSRLLKSITLSGNDTLENITIAETVGDVSKITIESFLSKSQMAQFSCFN